MTQPDTLREALEKVDRKICQIKKLADPESETDAHAAIARTIIADALSTPTTAPEPDENTLVSATCAARQALVDKLGQGGRDAAILADVAVRAAFAGLSPSPQPEAAPPEDWATDSDTCPQCAATRLLMGEDFVEELVRQLDDAGAPRGPADGSGNTYGLLERIRLLGERARYDSLVEAIRVLPKHAPALVKDEDMARIHDALATLHEFAALSHHTQEGEV